MVWFGADSGGFGRFGLAMVLPSGDFVTARRSSVDEALEWITSNGTGDGVGIDCPLWWCTGRGGGRKADSWLRKTYGIHSGTVQSVNSLRGRCIGARCVVGDALARTLSFARRH